jgi:peptide/nickel transport system ATP-binding protein
MISAVEPSPLRGPDAGGDEATGTLRQPVLELQKLVVDYRLAEGRVRAVDGIDLAIEHGEILGLAGESGCGKSTVANAVMQILRPPARITGGSILFRGEDVTSMSPDRLRRYAGATFRWSSRAR